jgi:hypothetical protein
MSSISITEAQIFAAIGNVLTAFGLVSASGLAIPIVRGQVNRVPEPASPDFAVMWPIHRDRLATNVRLTSDNALTGSISGTVLTVSALNGGSVAIGQPVYGLTTAPNTVILSQIGGAPSGVGTYAVSVAQTVPSGPLYCGTTQAMQPMELTIQVDVHGPASADNVTRIATLWRDQFGVDACQAQGDIIAPLYTSDPRQMPFDNAEQQVEERWSIDLCCQANPVVTVTQQFAAELTITTIPVDVIYPVD